MSACPGRGHLEAETLGHPLPKEEILSKLVFRQFSWAPASYNFVNYFLLLALGRAIDN